MSHVQVSRLVPAAQSVLFAYLLDLEMAPPTMAGRIRVEFLKAPERLYPGFEFAAEVSRMGIGAQFLARVDDVVPEEKISYSQTRGPWRTWNHTLLLEAHDPNNTRLTEAVDFRVPYGILGGLADDLFFRRDIEELLAHRLERIVAYFEREAVDHTPGRRKL